MKTKIYIPKKAKKHLGSKFEKILLKSGYKVSYKALDMLNENETDIVYISPDSALKVIDATFHGLSTNDKHLSKLVKSLKRLYCLDCIDESVAYKEVGNSFKLLNKSFLYLQMSNYNEEWSVEFASVDEMLKAYANETQFKQLYNVLSKDVGVVEVIELFLESTDALWFANKKDLPKDINNDNIFKALESLNVDWNSSERKSNKRYKLQYNQDEAFNVLFNMFPSIGLTNNKKKQFEELLSCSLSLNYEEKIRVIDALPTLSRFQVDELIKVFIDEGKKFEELSEEHPKDIVKLKKKCTEEWIAIKHKTLTNSLPSPKKLFSQLQKFVKGQDHVLKPLATILHYQQEIKYSQDNTLMPLGPILLAGATGSGKSFIVKTSSKLIDIPYVQVDASSLVSAGIKGYGISDIFKQVLRVCDFNTKRAESAIIFLDEFDKLLLHHDGKSIINQLLTVIEGGEAPITKSFEESSEFKDISSLDTNRMLFIFGGSFEHIQAKRTGHSGFLQQDNAAKELSFEDLESSGFPRELLGRIKEIFMLNSLNLDDYLNILKTGKDSPIRSYTQLLESTHGNKVSIDDNVLHAVSKMAAKSDYGARGLQQIVHKLFENVLFEAPESNKKHYYIGMESLGLLKYKIDKTGEYHE